MVSSDGANEGAATGTGNAIKASGSDEIVGVGFDKSDAILTLIDDGYLLCTMAQNPDVMGSEGVKAAVKAINGEELGGEVVKVVFLMELAGLKGRERLKGYEVESVLCYDGK